MRKLIIILVALAVLAGGAYGGRKVYRKWKEHRAMDQAKEALAKSEYNKAGLWLRKALQANGNNREAVRMMGDFTEMIGAGEAVMYWRKRLVDLESSTTNRLLLARAGIVYRDFDTAKKALDGIDDAGKKTADFHKTMGAFATTTGQYLEAEKQFEQACKLEPQNPVPLLNLAMIRIQRKDEQLAGEARQNLQNLITNAAVGTDALRHLTLDAMRHTNHTRALELARALVAHTNALFNDRLMELDVLAAAKSAGFQSTLTALQKEVTTNAPRVFALSRWMLKGSGAQDTLAWLQTIGPEIRTNLPVTMVVADCFLGTTNWTALQAWVQDQQWGELEYVRLAMNTRALREQKLDSAAKSEWAKVMKAAEGRLDRLVALQRLAATWNWPTELEDVLWLVVNKFPSEKGAVQALSQLLYVGGKTRSLLTLYAQEIKSSPDNLAVKNNLASVAMLLNASEHRPYELAREVYEKQKDNPAFASTYAYSLFLQEKTADALKIMDQLKPEQLEQPSIAGYYAVMLAAAGDKEKAKKYLDLTAKARVLPEEAELFRKVRL